MPIGGQNDRNNAVSAFQIFRELKETRIILTYTVIARPIITYGEVVWIKKMKQYRRVCNECVWQEQWDPVWILRIMPLHIVIVSFSEKKTIRFSSEGEEKGNSIQMIETHTHCDANIRKFNFKKNYNSNCSNKKGMKKYLKQMPHCSLCSNMVNGRGKNKIQRDNEQTSQHLPSRNTRNRSW